MKKIISTLAFVIGIIWQLQAQTVIKDTVLYTKMVLTKSASPYLIKGNITVKPKGIFEVQPGVTLLISPTASYFQNDGTVLIKGAINDSIILKSSTNNRSNYFFTSSGLNPFIVQEYQYLVISNFNDIKIGGFYNDENVGVKNSRIYNCNFGLYWYAKDCYIHNCNLGVNRGRLVTNTKFSNCDVGIVGSQDFLFDSLEFYNNQIGIKESGLYFGGSMGRKILNSTFKNNVTGVEYYCTDGVRYFTFDNNKIIENDSGIVCVRALYRDQTESPFKNNKVCNNKYNVVYRELYTNSKLNDMCFCTNDTIEIRNKIYDGRKSLEYAYLSLGNIELNCTLDNSVINADTLTLSGTVHQASSFLKNGKVVAYNIDKNTFKETITDANGNFTFDSLAIGNYVIKAIPNNGENYLTTFFPNKSDSLSAVKINLDADITSVDIFMNSITGIDNTNGGGVITKPNPFENQLFVEVLENTSTGIQASISNAVGDVITQLSIPANENEFSINTTELPSGFYFLKVETGTKVLVHKVLKR